MHITCDGCNAEVVVPVPRDGIDARETPDELISWRRTGLRDLCPACRSPIQRRKAASRLWGAELS
jgi:hypothetical protein